MKKPINIFIFFAIARELIHTQAPINLYKNETLQVMAMMRFTHVRQVTFHISEMFVLIKRSCIPFPTLPYLLTHPFISSQSWTALYFNGSHSNTCSNLELQRRPFSSSGS